MPTLRLLNKQVAKFISHPSAADWLEQLAKPSTKSLYSYWVWRISEETGYPINTLQNLWNDTDGKIGELKRYLLKLYQKSPRNARNAKNALQNFVNYWNNTGTKWQIAVSLPTKKRWKQTHWGFEEAEKIAQNAKKPYADIFRLMFLSGIGEQEFMEINTNPEIYQSILQQVHDGKTITRIEMPPRKDSPQDYVVLAPRDTLEPLVKLGFPIRSQWNIKPIDGQNLRNNFKAACRRAGLEKTGTGPHTFRSIFRSEGSKRQVAISCLEAQMGHSAPDKYGYDRSAQDLEWRAQELYKLWAAQVNTYDEIAKLNRELSDKVSREEVLRIYHTIDVVTEILEESSPQLKAEFAHRLTQRMVDAPPEAKERVRRRFERQSKEHPYPGHEKARSDIKRWSKLSNQFK